MNKQFLYSTAALIAIISFWFIWQNTTIFHSITCNQFIDTRVKSIDFTSIKNGTESTWIDTHFAWNSKQFTTHLSSRVWMWESLNKEYRLHVKYPLIKLRQLWRYSTVTIDDMLRCLGEPQAYSVVAEVGPDAKRYSLSFFYEQKGYVVTAQHLYDIQSPQITRNLQLFYVEIVPANPSVEMLKNSLLLYDSKVQTTWSNALKPWPGVIEDVEQNPTLIYPEGVE